MKLNPEIVKFRLGVWTPQPSDGRSLSRLFGPLNAMRRQDPRLEIVRPEFVPARNGYDLDWHFFTGLDAVLLLDPYTPADLGFVTLARACGCRVWVDYIDDLFSVPASNPNYNGFADREAVRASATQIIERADVVTATTFTLKCRLPHKERILVLPESCRWDRCPFPRQRVVSWRGSPSHAEDIESVLPQLAEVAALPQLSLWKWVFLGFDGPDWRIARAFPNAKEQLLFVPWLPPYDYMNTWGGFAPYLHLAPLVDSAFNRAKSPLAWLEASAVGAATIGPALPEWNVAEGLLRYSSPAEFGEILKREMFGYVPPDAVSAPLSNFHPAALESRRAIYPAQTLAAVNEKRWVILNQLAKGKIPAQAAEPQPAEMAVTA